jgi:ribonuclease HII
MGQKPTFKLEKALCKEGKSLIAGVDEAGTGSLAAGVVSAAVIFTEFVAIRGLNDSKQLTPQQRNKLFDIIYERAAYVGVGIVSHHVINEINIYWSARRAMLEAIADLDVTPDYLLIDGDRPLKIDIEQKSIVKGDRKSQSIAAASIIAKVTRDIMMEEYSKVYPDYFFHQHKGYSTKLHLENIKKYGPCPIHRIHFRGVKEHICT